MAEIAAGALVAEQVVSTGVEAGVAVAVAKPTQPLQASLSRLATAPSQDDSLALARSRHTVTTIGNKAYIFGGESSHGQLCPNDLHAITLGDDEPGNGEYAVYPPVAVRDNVPAPRRDHAACAWGETVIVHGGRGSNDNPPDEASCLWQWDAGTAQWSVITATGLVPAIRSGHQLLSDKGNGFILLLGGEEGGQPAKTIWLFEFETRTWSQLPPPPSVFSAAQYVDGTIYCISDDEKMGGSLFVLKLASSKDESSAAEWTTVDFPANPLTPGPPPRSGSALLVVKTGLGRYYLLYLLGCQKNNRDVLYEDMWSLQLPSGSLTAAQLKDSIRDTLPGTSSGKFSWHELNFAAEKTTGDSQSEAPRLGARCFFAADTCKDGKGVVIWGGLNSSGKAEADGWLLKTE